MKSITTALVVGLLAVVGPGAMASAASRTQQEQQQAQTSQFAACEEAINCMVVTDEKGHMHRDFIPGMEPGSAWYNETKQASQAYLKKRALIQGPEPQSTSKGHHHSPRLLQKRKGCDDEFCIELFMSEKRHDYGDLWPRDLADGLWDNCELASCNVEWKASMKNGRTRKDIKMVAHGKYEEEFRHGLIWGLTELSVADVSEGTRSIPALGRQDAMAWRVYSGPKVLQMDRYAPLDDGRRFLQGSIDLRFEEADGDSSTCDAVMKALEVAMFKFPPAGLISLACMAE